MYGIIVYTGMHTLWVYEIVKGLIVHMSLNCFSGDSVHESYSGSLKVGYSLDSYSSSLNSLAIPVLDEQGYVQQSEEVVGNVKVRQGVSCVHE